jgi:hypothetical protein
MRRYRKQENRGKTFRKGAKFARFAVRKRVSHGLFEPKRELQPFFHKRIICDTARIGLIA